MKRKSFFLIALLTLFMSSCVYSLFPIYTEESIVYKPELLGEWYSGSQDAYITIESYAAILKAEEIENQKAQEEGKAPGFNLQNVGTSPGTTKGEDLDKSYRLTIVDSSRLTTNNKYYKEIFEAHLVDIEGQLFLDIIPERKAINADASDKLIPMHSFMKFDLEENSFRMVHFEYEKLINLFKSNLIRLRHEKINDHILITAQPKELQKFLARYAKDESVFGDVDVYDRRL